MSKNQTIKNLLTAANAIQLARVRAHLEDTSARWCTEYTPQEYQISVRALKAFDEQNYSDPAIARYMSRDVIEKIFG